MYAILVVETVSVLLCKDKTEWCGTIQNPEPQNTISLPRGSWNFNNQNQVVHPSYQSVRHIYTKSQLPPELDEEIVNKFKSIKRQQIIESFDNFCDIKNTEEDFAHIYSINQIHIKQQSNNHQLGVLDNIFIDLREILDITEKLGWKILHSTMNRHYSQFVLHKH